MFDSISSRKRLRSSYLIQSLEPRMLLAAVSWTGGGDGVLWSNRFNWSNNLVPTSADTVTISVGSNQIVGVAGTQTCKTLSLSKKLVVAAGATLTVSSGMTINAAGILAGDGTVKANVTNNGLVEPGFLSGSIIGQLTIQGNYTQSSTGALNIEIGGATAGTQYDQLTVTGTATLNGVVNTPLSGGYKPAAGTHFDVITYASGSGDFSTKNVRVGNGIEFATKGGLTVYQLTANSTGPTYVTRASGFVAINGTSGVAEALTATIAYGNTLQVSNGTTGTVFINSEITSIQIVGDGDGDFMQVGPGVVGTTFFGGQDDTMIGAGGNDTFFVIGFASAHMEGLGGQNQYNVSRLSFATIIGSGDDSLFLGSYSPGLAPPWTVNVSGQGDVVVPKEDLQQIVASGISRIQGGGTLDVFNVAFGSHLKSLTGSKTPGSLGGTLSFSSFNSTQPVNITNGSSPEIDQITGITTIIGGDGDDSFHVRDAVVEHINGGPGIDTAFTDSNDTTENIENFGNNTIAGTVFNDKNANGILDAGEVGIANWTVYHDANNNGTLDVDEESVATDASGNYQFTDVVGTNGVPFIVKQVLQSGLHKTLPSAGVPGYSIPLAGNQAGTNSVGNNFGNTTNIYLAGHVFNDLNANGVQDAGENAIAGVKIDVISNGVVITSRTSDAAGFWQVRGLSEGTGEIDATPPAGYQIVAPQAGKYSGPATSGQQLGNLNFGLRLIAPAPLPFRTQAIFASSIDRDNVLGLLEQV